MNFSSKVTSLDEDDQKQMDVTCSRCGAVFATKFSVQRHVSYYCFYAFFVFVIAWPTRSWFVLGA
jgi:hypothetical protein